MKLKVDLIPAVLPSQFSVPILPSQPTLVFWPVFVVMLSLLFFQSAEGFAGEIWAINIHRVENIAELITSSLIRPHQYRITDAWHRDLLATSEREKS